MVFLYLFVFGFLKLFFKLSWNFGNPSCSCSLAFWLVGDFPFSYNNNNNNYLTVGALLYSVGLKGFLADSGGGATGSLKLG